MNKFSEKMLEWVPSSNMWKWWRNLTRIIKFTGLLNGLRFTSRTHAIHLTLEHCACRKPSCPVPTHIANSKHGNNSFPSRAAEQLGSVAAKWKEKHNAYWSSHVPHFGSGIEKCTRTPEMKPRSCLCPSFAYTNSGSSSSFMGHHEHRT